MCLCLCSKLTWLSSQDRENLKEFQEKHNEKSPATAGFVVHSKDQNSMSHCHTHTHTHTHRENCQFIAYFLSFVFIGHIHKHQCTHINTHSHTHKHTCLIYRCPTYV